MSPVKSKFIKRGSYSLEQTQVLPSNTPLIQIRKDDIHQLAIDNPRETKLQKERIVSLLSKNVTMALYGTNHSSLQEIIDRVEEKRRRRHSTNVFKTAASELTKRAEEQRQALVTKALPSIMTKTSDTTSR